MFKDFDFGILDSPDFKEDSVREEIIIPILRSLGYSASGTNRVIRSKSLAHPYVHIGTKKHTVKIIPDYLIKAGEEFCWVLDAKSPREDIQSGKNVEQAFSYAIHPEIRAFRYALCNGRELVVFDVNKIEPQLYVKMEEVEDRFHEVERLLSPIAFTNPFLLTFKPDFGLHMLKLGMAPNSKHVFTPIGIGTIAKIEDNLYTAFIEVQFGDLSLALSLDFDQDRFHELIQVLPKEQAPLVSRALSKQPFAVAFKNPDLDLTFSSSITQVLPSPYVVIGDTLPEVCVEAKLGHQVHIDEYQDYLPLWVERFFVL